MKTNEEITEFNRARIQELDPDVDVNEVMEEIFELVETGYVYVDDEGHLYMRFPEDGRVVGKVFYPEDDVFFQT